MEHGVRGGGCAVPSPHPKPLPSLFHSLLTGDDPSSSVLSSFRSRCATPKSWQWETARQNWMNKKRAVSRGRTQPPGAAFTHASAM